MARGTSLANMALGDFRELTKELPDSVKIPVSLVFIRTLLNGECEWTLVQRDEYNERFQLEARNGGIKAVKDIPLGKYNTAPPPPKCTPKDIVLDD